MVCNHSEQTQRKKDLRTKRNLFQEFNNTQYSIKSIRCSGGTLLMLEYWIYLIISILSTSIKQQSPVPQHVEQLQKPVNENSCRLKLRKESQRDAPVCRGKQAKRRDRASPEGPSSLKLHSDYQQHQDLQLKPPDTSCSLPPVPDVPVTF